MLLEVNVFKVKQRFSGEHKDFAFFYALRPKTISLRMFIASTLGWEQIQIQNTNVSHHGFSSHCKKMGVGAML